MKSSVHLHKYNGRPVRLVDYMHQRWVVATDVCRALELKQGSGYPRYFASVPAHQRLVVKREDIPRLFMKMTAPHYALISVKAVHHITGHCTPFIAQPFEDWLEDALTPKPPQRSRKAAAAARAAAMVTVVDPEPEESVATPSRSMELTLHEIEGEPLVLDEDLARELGYGDTDAFRRLIKRNADELSGYGLLRQVDRKAGLGRPSRPYYLNEEQALLLCMFSGAEKAKEIRKQVIAVYQAWRKGHLRPIEKPQEPTTPSIPTDFASALRLAADEHERRLRLEAEKVVLIEERNEASVRADKAEAEINHVTIQEWAALNHLYLMHGQKVRMGARASKLARERGLNLEKQYQIVKRGTPDERTVGINVYPRSLLDEAALTVLGKALQTPLPPPAKH